MPLGPFDSLQDPAKLFADSALKSCNRATDAPNVKAQKKPLPNTESVKQLTPEWRAIVEAAREIELENQDALASVAAARTDNERLTQEKFQLQVELQKSNEGEKILENELRLALMEIEKLRKRMAEDRIRAHAGGAAPPRRTMQSLPHGFQGLSEIPGAGGFFKEGQPAHAAQGAMGLPVQSMPASILSELYQQTEYLRRVYPVKGMLEAKQLELKRLKRSMEAIERDHPERKQVEALVRAAIAERDGLAQLVEGAEEAHQSQLENLNEALRQAGHAPVEPNSMEEPSLRQNQPRAASGSRES